MSANNLLARNIEQAWHVLVESQKKKLARAGSKPLIQEFRQAQELSRSIDGFTQELAQNPQLQAFCEKVKQGKLENLPDKLVIKGQEVSSQELADTIQQIPELTQQKDTAEATACTTITRFLRKYMTKPSQHKFKEVARQTRAYNTLHQSLKDETIQDGFHMRSAIKNFDTRATGTEMLQVDRARDKTLRETIDAIKKEIPPDMTEVQKIVYISKRVQQLYGKVPAEDTVNIYKSLGQLVNADENRTILLPLGDTIQAGAGMCRHRALLTKLLADELGLKASIEHGMVGNGGHAWNQFRLSNGKALVVDTTLPGMEGVKIKGAKDDFTQSYLKARSWYRALGILPQKVKKKPETILTEDTFDRLE